MLFVLDQRNLGRMLNVKSATVDDVKAALAMSYKKKEQEQMKNISFAECMLIGVVHELDSI